MVRPWAIAGYDCYAVDQQHAEGIHQIDDHIYAVGADLLDCISSWFPIGRSVRISFGFPPCTHTAVSGAKHFRSKGARKAAEAFALIARVETLLNWFDAPYAWEQPVATTSTYCGQPDYRYDPCDYGGYLDEQARKADAYMKKTCLWTGGGFIMPTPRPIAAVTVCPQGSWIQQLGGSSQKTKNLRSATPMGFATAVWLSNDGWQIVQFAADCDDDGLCPIHWDDYAECPCIGPTEDDCEYLEIGGVMYGKRLGTIDDQISVCQTND